MEKMIMKKFIIATAVCCLSLVGLSACSLSELFGGNTQEKSGLEFVEIGDSYAVAGIGTCEDYRIEIPETYNGKPVTTIAKGAFEKVFGVTQIIAPNSVKTVEDKAFSACTHLEKVSLVGVESIGEEAFSYCNALEEVSFGENLEVIGDKAFYTCERLPEISFPDSLAEIGDEAFFGNTRLSEVNFGTGLEYLGVSAFEDCQKIVEIVIPDGAETIICDKAFYNCRGMRTLDIGDSVKQIGVEAFNDCLNLTFATIGDGVIRIGDKAFESARSLVKLTLGSSVGFIGRAAFYNCYKLVDVYNRSNYELVGVSAEDGRLGYHVLNEYKQENGSKISITDDGCILFTDGNSVRLMGHTTTKSINLVVPDEVTEIHMMAFYNNTYISSITAGENLKKIGEQAFNFAYNLRTASFVGVESFEAQALSSCNKLTKIVLGSALKQVKENAFNGCKVLAILEFVGTSDDWARISFASGNEYLTKLTVNYQ